MMNEIATKVSKSHKERIMVSRVITKCISHSSSCCVV